MLVCPLYTTYWLHTELDQKISTVPAKQWSGFYQDPRNQFWGVQTSSKDIKRDITKNHPEVWTRKNNQQNLVGILIAFSPK